MIKKGFGLNGAFGKDRKSESVESVSILSDYHEDVRKWDDIQDTTLAISENFELLNKWI